MDEVAFEMITEDYNKTMEQLDSIRARKSKFVCVNDDMTNPSPELLQELENFYLSFFPAPSQFELPPGVGKHYCHRHHSRSLTHSLTLRARQQE